MANRRRKVTGSSAAARLAAAVTLTCLGIALAGCGSAHRPATPGSASTAQPTTTPRTTSTSSGVTTSTSSTPTTTTSAPVESGFLPLSFTAVSDSTYWVLGGASCASGRCAAIVQTTDGGGSFSSIPAPALEAATASGSEATLRFADRDDGWAFTTGEGGVFYATHNDGARWQPLKLGSLIAFATGGGYVYAVTARCAAQRCTGFRFATSPVSRDAWTSRPLPFTPDGPVLELSAHGSNVLLLGTRAGQMASRYDLLARSTDAGRTFAVGDGPCVPGLGGRLAASSASVVWAVCPTGTLAGASRSSDGGMTFAPLHGPELANSAGLAPASDTSVLLYGSGVNKPLLTTDAGGHWTRPHVPAGATFWSWAGFSDAITGAALVQTHYDKVERRQLWRTIDGGQVWTQVKFH